jgi:hypothetical protein
MAQSIVFDRIEPWWTFEHRDLEYVHENFNNEDDVRRWRDLGFTQQRFTGNMYDMRFPEPHWMDRFRTVLPLRHWSWSVYRMRPGDIIPEHSDTYAKFCEIHNIADVESIRRYVVFLENWQSGHYFEIDRSPVSQWTAGQIVGWTGGTPHVAANLGNTMRYTLQITGQLLQT